MVDHMSYMELFWLIINVIQLIVSALNVQHTMVVFYMTRVAHPVGFLETIVKFIDKNDFALIIRPAILHSTADILSMGNRIYSCTNVLYGTPYGSSITIINHTCLMQKLAFRSGTNSDFPPLVKSMFFFQFPNRRSSTWENFDSSVW